MCNQTFLGDWAWGHSALCPSRKVQEREGVSNPAGRIISLDSVDQLWVWYPCGFGKLGQCAQKLTLQWTWLWELGSGFWSWGSGAGWQESSDPRFPAPSSWLEGDIILHTLERPVGEGAHLLCDSRALLRVKGGQEDTVSAPSPYKHWLPEVPVSFPGELPCLKPGVSYTNKVIWE